jgi:hypothetical protein
MPLPGTDNSQQKSAHATTSRLSHYLRYVAESLALGILGNLLTPLLNPQWALKGLGWAIGLVVAIAVGYTVALLLDQRTRITRMDAALRDLSTNVHRLYRKLAIQVQKRFTHLSVQIHDSTGDRATITKRVGFIAVDSSISVIREDVGHLDGSAPPPTLKLERLSESEQLMAFSPRGWNVVLDTCAMTPEDIAGHH